MFALRKHKIKQRNEISPEAKQRNAMNINTDITLPCLLYGSSIMYIVFKNTLPPSESEKQNENISKQRLKRQEN